MPHRISGGVQVGSTQRFALQTRPPLQSPSPQHSKQPCWAQQRPPPAQAAENTQVPLLPQLSAVQRSPSLQSAELQHCRQLVPQSLGVLAAQLHTEAAQIAPGLHALGQLPQWPGSLRVSISQPSPATPLQLAKPEAQVGTPATQAWFGPTARPQVPQLAESVWRLTQEAPPQSVCPGAQPVTQLTPLQIGVPPLHRTLQLPHVCGALACASQPGLASQFKKPARQPQVALLQVVLTPQLLVQEPQVSGREKSVSQPSSGIWLQFP
jgi:hypothetical protein